MDNIGFYTHLVGAFAFGVLASLMLFHWRARPLGPTLFIACLFTNVWATTIALGTLADYPPITLIQLAEALRDGAWLLLLLQLVSLQTSGTPWRWGDLRWPPVFIAATVLLLGLIGQHALPKPLLATDLQRNLTLGIWLSLAVAALLLIEQLYRNAGKEERWSLKFFCLSLGGLFTYDFFMYAEALLFRRLDAELWQARGIVTAIGAPWLAVAIARNRAWAIGLEVSRHVVFHSVTLMGAGLYLLGMAVIGYFIKYLGGSWGGVLQLGFLAASIGLLLSLLFSGKLRAQLRVLLSKHFFSYRYDYRDEWLKFTGTLAGLTDNVEEGVIRTMAPLAGSNAGLLFGAAGEGDNPRLLASWNMPAPTATSLEEGNLPAWCARTGWVVDFHERKRVPEMYDDLTVPAWIQEDPSLWLAIPLMFAERVEGVLILRESNVKNSLNWEDRDLLKTAGRQAASHLAQHLASKALAEARQFDAFNRLSAYVIHDLKNILAQQSLIVSNATKHRDNPAFIDDMIDTVANSVARMQRLMDQMRSGERSAKAGRVELRGLLQEVASARSAMRPAPRLDLGALDLYVEADRERLATVFGHLVQNAQEATPADGEVRLVLSLDRQAAQVTVSDTGRGMDAAFIRERLFRPFESTKGLTGMGIGAFESREYIRQLGGDITVDSEPDRGSVFRVTMRLAAAPAMQSDKEVAA